MESHGDIMFMLNGMGWKAYRICSIRVPISILIISLYHQIGHSTAKMCQYCKVFELYQKTRALFIVLSATFSTSREKRLVAKKEIISRGCLGFYMMLSICLLFLIYDNSDR